MGTSADSHRSRPMAIAGVQGKGHEVGIRVDDRFRFPDISVGRLFSAWLTDNYAAVADNYVEYIHIFMDGRQIPNVRAYPNSLLGIFRDYVINVWMREQAPKYLGRVDPPAVP